MYCTVRYSSRSSSLPDSLTVQLVSFSTLIMPNPLKKGFDKLRAKLSSSRSPSPAPPRIAQNTGLQPRQRSPDPANEAASDLDIAPNAQSGATADNIALSQLNLVFPRAGAVAHGRGERQRARPRRDAHRRRHGRVQPERLAHDRVEVGQLRDLLEELDVGDGDR